MLQGEFSLFLPQPGHWEMPPYTTAHTGGLPKINVIQKYLKTVLNMSTLVVLVPRGWSVLVCQYCFNCLGAAHFKLTLSCNVHQQDA